MLDLLLVTLAVLRAACHSRGDLVLENLLLRHRLAAVTRPTRRRPARFRRPDKLLRVLVRRLRRDRRRHLVVVTPGTVVRWHCAGWRLCWRWQSRATGGRQRLSAEVRDLIARMSKGIPWWDSERIRGELLKLGSAVSNRSVRRYRGRPPARPPSQTWRTFWGRRPTHLVRDCVDHLIPLDERHLRAVLAECVDFYNRQRPHRTLGLVPPQPLPGHGARAGPICSLPVPGGLHRVNERAA